MRIKKSSNNSSSSSKADNKNKDKNDLKKTVFDADDLALIAANNIISDNYVATSSNYLLPKSDYVSYEDYAMEVSPAALSKTEPIPLSQLEENNNNNLTTVATAAVFDDDGKRQLERGIELNRHIRLVEYLQKPYRDVQLARHEAAVRRNWAIQTAIGVREFFMFAEKSELVVEISEAQTYGLTENQKQNVIDLLKEKLKGTAYDITELIKAAYERDIQLQLETKLRTAYWQCLTYGDAYILKIFDDIQNNPLSQEITKLYPINSRRVNELIPDPKHQMKIEGAWVDGQALDRTSMIQFHYQPHQISAHTEGYGYTPLESILNLAEGLNIFYEEDVKEIQRSAWLSSILLTVNTAGLRRAEAQARIKSVVDSIDPGKIIGVGGQGENGLKAESLDLKSDLGGLSQIGEYQEAKIFKAFRVPQFLVQSEDIANRATADKAAELFLSGVIQSDQMWLSANLDDQWYDPFLRDKLGLDDDEPLPFRITRKFKIPTVSEFIDLADGLLKLLQGGVWDIEQANEKLGTPEVADRIANQDTVMPQQQQQQLLPGEQGTNTAAYAPPEPSPASLTFGGADSLEDFKDDPKEQLKALLQLKYQPEVKSPKVSSKGLTSAVKKKKLEMLQHIIDRIQAQ